MSYTNKNPDFDFMMNMFKEDPQAFDDFARNEINKLISHSDDRNVAKLRHLQSTLDQQKQRILDEHPGDLLKVTKNVFTQMNASKMALDAIASEDTLSAYKEHISTLNQQLEDLTDTLKGE